MIYGKIGGILLKNLLVADYDNTLYTDEISLLKNINKIKEFRKLGNYFAISTSRGYTSLTNEIEKYKIPYDFICTNNGAVISNNKGKIIYKNFLNIEDFNKIEKVLENYYNIEITRYYLNSIKIQNKEKSTNNYDIVPDEIIGYKIKGNIEILNAIKKSFEIILNNFEISIKENKKLFLNSKKNTKEKAIKQLLKEITLNYQLSSLSSEKIMVYTVGDDDVDFGMLKNYNGFRMEKSSELLMKNIKKSTKSVEELINYIENWNQMWDFLGREFGKFLRRDFGVGDKNHGCTILNKNN